MRTIKVLCNGCGCNWKSRTFKYVSSLPKKQPFNWTVSLKSTLCTYQFHRQAARSLAREKTRAFTTATSLYTKSGTFPETKEAIVNPFNLTEEDVRYLGKQIKEELKTSILPLQDCSYYYFDGQGKYFRPTTVFLLARACNSHQHQKSFLSENQRKVAMVAEMIHTASLLHDDVIDEASTRRNKPSVNKMWSDKQAILAGDFILSRASISLARIGSVQVVEIFAEIIENLVKGELMQQLMSKDDPDQRFKQYLSKTFKKTASLVAYSCKAVALLGGCNEVVQSISYDFGKNLGIAFQLVDDALDFTSTSSDLGKAAGADLKSGLATAPILFAAEMFPDLNVLVMRRFREPGDVEKAFDCVRKSDGVEKTMSLASKYQENAVKLINKLNYSKERDGLISLANFVTNRKK